MPFGVTPTDAILQIVTVGLGSWLGGEVAPRELGAVLARKTESSILSLTSEI